MIAVHSQKSEKHKTAHTSRKWAANRTTEDKNEDKQECKGKVGWSTHLNLASTKFKLEKLMKAEDMPIILRDREDILQ